MEISLRKWLGDKLSSDSLKPKASDDVKPDANDADAAKSEPDVGRCASPNGTPKPAQSQPSL